MVRDLMQRMRTHAQRNRHFFLIEDADDESVDTLYSNAAGMLFLSLGEGFGLPLIEAAHHGTPILCSDLPVCREVAGAHAEYVRLSSAESLAASIEDWWIRWHRGAVRQSHGMQRLDWEKSAEMLLDVVLNNRWMAADADAQLQGN